MPWTKRKSSTLNVTAPPHPEDNDAIIPKATKNKSGQGATFDTTECLLVVLRIMVNSLNPEVPVICLV